MSACISRHGEYSEHTPDGEYTCQRCLVLDEDALRAELRRLRAETTAEDAEDAVAVAARAILYTPGDEPGVLDSPGPEQWAEYMGSAVVKALADAGLLRGGSAETTTATAEDAALDAATEAVEAEFVSINAGSDHGARDVAEAAIEAYLLARPLPDRDELARALREGQTGGLCMLGVECDLCDCDSPARKDGLALRDADVVLDLLRGGGGDR